MKGIASLLPLVAFLVLLWLLFVRPSRARQQRALALRASVSVGQRIVTTSGLHATVVAVDDATVALETSPGVVSTWAIGAVGAVSAEVDADADADADAERSP